MGFRLISLAPGGLVTKCFLVCIGASERCTIFLSLKPLPRALGAAKISSPSFVISPRRDRRSTENKSVIKKKKIGIARDISQRRNRGNKKYIESLRSTKTSSLLLLSAQIEIDVAQKNKSKIKR